MHKKYFFSQAKIQVSQATFHHNSNPDLEVKLQCQGYPQLKDASYLVLLTTYICLGLGLVTKLFANSLYTL